MIDKFPAFGKLTAAAFQKAAKSNDVFVVGIEPDELYRLYLAAFPEGTNPMLKERTEHDCSCCKQFVRRAGNVVTVENGKMCTIWDTAAEKAPEPYNIVATAMRDVVLGAEITDLYRVSKKESQFGNQITRSMAKDSGKVVQYDHFYTGPIPAGLMVESPDQVRGDYRTTVQVFSRGLNELRPSAVDTVLGLIEANAHVPW